MGNTTSGKRHNSGDDSGPTITANNRLADTSLEEADFDYSAVFKRGSRDLSIDHYQRPRSNTVTHSPVQTEKVLPTVFRWEGGGKEIYLSGSFNNWKTKIQLAKSNVRQTDRNKQRQEEEGNGDFFTILNLPEGEHQYKFLVDGLWVHDPDEPTVPNALGTLNNVVLVRKSDFEVFEALAIDSENCRRKNDFNTAPPGEYGQDMPPRRAEKVHGPPFIPPHLLQVILNKDTPAHCEPTLLPEPNHVMLNHLYALSIKDGVMVLSATHRFRKKYVTTLLYKPI